VDKEVKISFSDDLHKVELAHDSVDVTVSNRSFARCEEAVMLLVLAVSVPVWGRVFTLLFLFWQQTLETDRNPPRVAHTPTELLDLRVDRLHGAHGDALLPERRARCVMTCDDVM
jgi:hypothetical protein